ncbi:Regulator of G protein signalling domain and Regulator of G protein signalling superfamily domain and Regulator of G-protein signalling, domain 1-containing protein [Strongyloides ratti]|uniref:Regulator of G protein signalling domain and Regulator of G protein signalling superfamily domain and Regulator of G-protein signalling, domain 1-containing protein n=1 Tax=Strongyloides ratti TaxID=34506 RepID=A0A090LDS0_STRRB|nr:Regulator of G protein signalling domain and Regulator of G protein signalling superfamily domain and Regulator of G-protein signalling, domain 1-containing protein [Strongyloides ratti]CEF66268.1 Regulator of G protein signalling domain and Regulator of G protein signalling superfamily domain and Regulator of G-protein signalling, domain 1-containing protein [Strongyloides ratti]
MNKSRILHRQYILLYHGYNKVTSTYNSFILEQSIGTLKKDSAISTTVTLELLDFNIVVRTSYNSEILNLPYSDFCDYAKSSKKPLYFGLIFEEGSTKCRRCYIFSIDSNLVNHTFHEKYSILFNFECSQNFSLYSECDQFPSNVDQIIESTNFFRNILSDDFMDCINDNEDEHVSPIHEEFVGNRQKRKVEDKSYACHLLVKRPSLGGDALEEEEEEEEEAVFDYSECYYPTSEKDNNHGSQLLLETSSSNICLFYKTLDDELLRKPFMKFLEEQFCQENLIFYIIVQKYRIISNEGERIVVGKEVIRNHLEENSTYQINIDDKIRKEILKNANEGRYNVELFDGAQFQITEMMKFDLWPRYLKTIDTKQSEPLPQELQKEYPHKPRLSLHSLKNRLLGKKNKKNVDAANYLWNCGVSQNTSENFSIHLDSLGQSFRSTKNTKMQGGSRRSFH